MDDCYIGGQRWDLAPEKVDCNDAGITFPGILLALTIVLVICLMYKKGVFR